MPSLRHLGEMHGVTLHVYTRMVYAAGGTPDRPQRRDPQPDEPRNSAQDMQRAVEAESNLQDVAKRSSALMHRNKESAAALRGLHLELNRGVIRTGAAKSLQNRVWTVELTRAKLNVDRLKLRQQAGLLLHHARQAINAFGTEYETGAARPARWRICSRSTTPARQYRKGFYIGKDKCGSNIVVDSRPARRGIKLLPTC